MTNTELGTGGNSKECRVCAVELTLAEKLFQLISIGPDGSPWNSWRCAHSNQAPKRERRVLRGITVVAILVGAVLLAYGGLRVYSYECAQSSRLRLPTSRSEFGDALAACPVPGNDSGWLLVRWDLPVIAGYVLLGTIVLAAGWWRYEAEPLRRASWVIALPAAAAVLGLIGLWLGSWWAQPDFEVLRANGFWSWTRGAILLTIVWLNWLCVAATIAAVAMAASVWFVRRGDSFPLTQEDKSPTGDEETSPSDTDADVEPAPDGHGEVVGVCVSGGGIRATAFALGVLSQLEPGGPGAPTAADVDRLVELPVSGDVAAVAAGSVSVSVVHAATDEQDRQSVRPTVPSAEPATRAAMQDPARHKDRRHEVDQPLPTDDPELYPPGTPRRDRRLLLDSPNREPLPSFGPLEQARYLCAVSGGAWAATAWTLQKAFGTGAQNGRWRYTNAADTVIRGLRHQSRWSPSQRQKYLLNSRWGIGPALGWVLFCALTNIAYVYSLIYLIAWPLGWFLGRKPITGEEAVAGECRAGIVLPDAFLPSIGLACAAALVLLTCGLIPRCAGWWPLGLGLLALSVLSAGYLAALPGFFHLIGCGKSAWIAVTGAVGTSLIVSIAGIAWKLIGGPLVHQLTERVQRQWLRLLGVLLTLTFFAWALVVMNLASTDAWTAPTMLIPLCAVLVISVALSPNFPSLHNIFAKRLRTSFDPTTGAYADARQDFELSTAKTWGALEALTRPGKSAKVPELVMGCAQQRNGIALGGLRAETFTISPRWVRQGGRVVKRCDYIEVTFKVKRWFGWHGQREYADLDKVSPWLATTGAAFSSAMGRASLGSTNALLATLNADLGIWLPNVIAVQQPDATDGSPIDVHPRPRMGYLLKEILGWYNKRDRYVFITDGGHWDNLGLVELLRRRCNVIYCIDASGDPPGTFATLRQALALATLELDGFAEEDIDIDDALTDVMPTNTSGSSTNSGPPRTCVTTLSIPRTLDDGTKVEVVIHYLKLQANQSMSKQLRRFAIADPKFPQYSTMKQFLTPKQFDNLIDIGKDSGAKLRRSAMRWMRTGDPHFPYAAEAFGQMWVLRDNTGCNGHPDYTLFVDSKATAHLSAADTKRGFDLPTFNDDEPPMDRDRATAAIEPIAGYAVYGAECGQPCPDCPVPDKR